MQIGIHAMQRDMDELVARCRQVGVNAVCLSCSCIRGYDEEGVPDPADLHTKLDQLRRAGIEAPAMILHRHPSQKVLTEGDDAETALHCQTLDVVGEAGVGSMLMYTMTDRPEDPAQEPANWEAVARFFRQLTAAAERSGVRLANHPNYLQDKLLRNTDGLLRVTQDVPSEFNGVTYCPGLYHDG